jgi:alginate O-acetyltransferase complex protein AlgI
VCLGWVFFNSSGLSQAFAVLGRMVTGWGEPSPLVTPLLVAIIFGSIALQYVPTLDVARLQATFSRQHVALQIGVLAFALLGITTFGPAGVAPFIYYRF